MNWDFNMAELLFFIKASNFKQFFLVLWPQASIWRFLFSIFNQMKSIFIYFDRSTNEVRDIHKDQMNEMEIRLSNSKQSEAILIDEISKLKNDYITEKAKYEAEQGRAQQLINDQSSRYRERHTQR